ncbi:MAG TPA: DUF2089 domain-containing protein [Anaerolineae bacterium]|nr:DUF2089 domain-containing protein [Anaerolineae bacterium]HQI83160.1 DUF2089 domain-containing protein [Anaerolineae bacterium]
MYPIPTRCPVCGDDLIVERLSCVQCGTAIEGTFVPHRLTQLTAEQWDFVELFVRLEGKLNRLQEELGLSYPTVRNRLHEVIRAMGYEVGELATEEEVMQSMLDDLAEGKITVDAVLKALKR